MMRLIDADALMETIRAHEYPLRSHFNSTDNGMFTIGIQQAVDEQPTITPDMAQVLAYECGKAERKRGRWRKVGNYGRCYKCDQCGNYLDFYGANAGRGVANFCPNCGADMRKGEEE